MRTSSGWIPVSYTHLDVYKRQTDDFKKDDVGIEIHSGKKRIVRRIFESLGYKVMKLRCV